jgi:tripartite-type tricarboxylate transporter receptor subunit TctC
MKIKKCFVLSLTVILLFGALVGCGRSAETSASTAGTSNSTGAVPKPLNYPKGNINFIIPFSAGGGTDISNRLWGKYLEELIGVPVICTNIEGGGGEIGVTRMSIAKPDGQTIGGFVTASVLNTCMRETAYKLSDITPIALIMKDARTFVVAPDEKRFSNFEEFVEYARQHPGEVTIGTSGSGTGGHFNIEAINYYAGVEFAHVPFGGAGANKAALMGGHIDACAVTVGEAYPMVQDGSGKVIAQMGETRSALFPGAQTPRDIGIDFVMYSARGIVCPAGVPEEIVSYLSDCFRKMCEDPTFLAKMESMGFPIEYLGYKEYAKFIAEEKALYDKLYSIIAIK